MRRGIISLGAAACLATAAVDRSSLGGHGLRDEVSESASCSAIPHKLSRGREPAVARDTAAAASSDRQDGGALFCCRMGADCILPSAAESTWHTKMDAKRVETFLKYEKRLRDHSDVEKLFDYFSSRRDGKEKFMTEMDVMRSVVSVFPVGSIRNGALDGERVAPAKSQLTRLGSAFDANGDGQISYTEYLFFLRLMSIKMEDLEIALIMADRDSSGEIDKDELLAALGWMHKIRPKQVARTGLAVDKANRDNFMPKLFGEDGRKHVPIKEVKRYISALHKDLAEVEFNHYDPEGTGSMSGTLFAYAMVSSMPLKNFDKYLSRAKNLPEKLGKADVSKKDFQEFVKLVDHSKMFTRACSLWLEHSAKMELSDFERAIRIVCKCHVSDLQLEIMFHLFQPLDSEDSFPAGVVTLLEERSLKKRAKATLASSRSVWKSLTRK